MCTTIAGHTPVSGSGRDERGWFRLERASVGYDHPFHAQLEHALLLDLTGDRSGAPARIAVELDLESARRLAALLNETVAAAEAYERGLDRVG